MNVHVFPSRELAIQARILKNDPKSLPSFVLMHSRIDAVDLYFSAGRFEQRCQHLYCGRFACAIGTEKCKNLTLRDVERHIIYRLKVAKCFCKMFRANHDGLVKSSTGVNFSLLIRPRSAICSCAAPKM